MSVMISAIKIDNSVSGLLTAKQVRYYKSIPISLNNGILSVYVQQGHGRPDLADELSLLTGKTISVTEIESDSFHEILNCHYPGTNGDSRERNPYFHGKPEDFLDTIIQEAKKLLSSDIHIEIYESLCRVRIRIDGMLIERYILDKDQYPSLINKIKITANLDIAEKRLPQDGRIFYKRNPDKFDIRVSILPTLYGEKIVLRLLTNNLSNVEVSELGFQDSDLSDYLESVRKPNGLILISGPTGSGKTTTLYATLKYLNKTSRNVLTIEDPIEYTLNGINQVQLKENIGLSFSVALRTFLRQDPDIIMLGEIRDVETADMAIRAALTGHLVLSTIHTNSALGIISRLIDMGIAPYLIATTLNAAIAQRLVRLLCVSCKQKKPFNKQLYPGRFKEFYSLQEHSVPMGCADTFFVDIPGATSQNLSFIDSIAQTTYYQRKVTCGSEIKYTLSVKVEISWVPVYYNSPVCDTFTRNNCASGYAGTDTVYCIDSAKYYSTISQGYVDTLALNDLNSNGQVFANTYGRCVVVCSSSNCFEEGYKCVNGTCELGTKVYTSSYRVWDFELFQRVRIQT